MANTYVLLCSGQSNIARIDEGVDWVPESNLHLWDFNAIFGLDGVGSRYISPPADRVNYGTLYANEIAKTMPDANVFVINVARGSTNLSLWLDETTRPNMWDALVNNVTAALNELPDDTIINEVLWWGHESDASTKADVSLDKFVEDFSAIIDKFDQQGWSGEKPAPIRLHKLHPLCNGLSSQINAAIENIVLRDTERYSLIDTTHLSYPDGIHLAGTDKPQAAAIAFSQPRPGVSAKKGVNANLIRKSQATASTLAELHDDKVVLPAGEWISHPLVFSKISDQTLTLSANHVTQALKVYICDETATVLAGKGRRQTSLRMPINFTGDVSVKIQNCSKEMASFSDLKLEYGGLAT